MNLVQKYPLPLFFVLAYAISWVVWSPLWLPHFGVASLPVLPYHHALGALGPLVAAFMVTAWHEGPGGVQQLVRRMAPGRVQPYWYLVVLAGPFLLYLLADAVAAKISGREVRLQHYGLSEEYPEFGMLGFFAFNLVFYGFGEETGWRGFALPRLQRQYSKFMAATVLTIFWAVWHIPLFFYRPGYTSMDWAGIAGWTVSLWTGSLLLSWLYNVTKESILVVSIFHATIDIAFFAAADPVTTNGLGFLITLWGVTIIVKYYFYARREQQGLKLP
jgi:membrane protease YdiL (CAAX protease family)